MTNNERRMMFVLAKGMNRLSDALLIFAKKTNDEDTAQKLKSLLEENNKEVSEFMDLVGKEWLKSE